MSEVKFSVPVDTVVFHPNGQVEITDQAFARSIKELQDQADLVACSTNNGCGNEINGQGCGKVNAKCAVSVGDGSLILVRPDEGKIIFTDKAVVDQFVKAKTENVADVGLSVIGYKQITQ